MIYYWTDAQQQCILFKIHKAYNTLCSANSNSANLGGTKIINKGVTELHIKKKEKENKYNNTQKEKSLAPTQAQSFFIWKKKDKLQLKVYTTYQVNFLKYSIE